LSQVRQRYEDRGRAMAASNERQAMLPEGASPIINPVGTAPGFSLELGDGTRLYCLPGVPHEMRRMWTEEVRPELCRLLSITAPSRHLFRTIGRGESQLQDLLGHLPAAFPGVDLGFRTRMPENQVKLTATADCMAFEAAVERCRELLGKDCFSEDSDLTLAGRVGQLLLQRGERVAIAESCTGGWIAHLCVTEAGSSNWFERGIVSYSNESKIDLLGVTHETLETHGAVSDPTALEMARGVALRSQAHWGLAVTGIAGPGGGSEDKPVGTVHVAVFGPAGERSKRLFFPTGDRTMTRRFSAFVALDMLRRQVLRLSH
ncbi:MAG: nicotinamide-nucleotide amidohydrolase family protein, partial [Myxococcota bacterium]|nr:nicotinamide-nucleotide amidohydrolase family protein [Myxococcota bacterium]